MFGRRSTSASDSDATTASGSGATSAEKLGKGRATPTRKEAEAQRKQRMTPPRTRKEQAARRKGSNRDGRAKMREAMETGNDAYLPARDKGPVKRHVRDYVDSRRTMGEVLLPIFFMVFVLVILGGRTFAALGQYAWLIIIVLMAADSIRISRGVKKSVTSKFGAAESKGISMYAVMRAWQMRRLRLPKPQVSNGAKV